MHILLTGSLGNISKPLAATLIQKGHAVTVVSSHDDRKKEIEALGGKAAIGSLEDAAFLTDSFRGADAVYLMVPPIMPYRITGLITTISAKAIKQPSKKPALNGWCN